MLPGCGFGFWYIYGVYHQMLENCSGETFFMLGKSGGAVVCFLSLLKKECQEFPFLIRICQEIKEEENNKWSFNLHRYVRGFCERLVPFLDSSSVEKQLQHIEIRVTKVSTCAFCVPYRLKVVNHTPTSIDHLINLVCASCYVPTMSRSGINMCCYTMDDEWVFDGAFLDIFFDTEHDGDTFQKIRSEYSQFSFPTRTNCIEMYYNGYLNPCPGLPMNRKVLSIKPFEITPPVFACITQLAQFVKQSVQPLALSNEFGAIIKTSSSWSVNEPVRCIETGAGEYIITLANGKEHHLRTTPVFVPNTDNESQFLLTSYFILNLTDLKSPPHII